jgi:hypothetical protein
MASEKYFLASLGLMAWIAPGERIRREGFPSWLRLQVD